MEKCPEKKKKKLAALKERVVNLAQKIQSGKKGGENTPTNFDEAVSSLEWKLLHEIKDEANPARVYFKYFKKQNFVKMKMQIMIPADLCSTVAPAWE